MLFCGEINDGLASSIVAQLLFLAAKIQKISIYTLIPEEALPQNGNFDTMNYILPDVSTACVGMAASMAAFLLASRKGKRYALPNSEILIHQPMGGAQGQVTEIQIAAEHILKVKERMNVILSEKQENLYHK